MSATILVSVRELHDRTWEILGAVANGKPMFVTPNGRPIVVIRGLSAEDLQDLVMLHEPTFRKELEQALADLAAGPTVPLDETIAVTEGGLGRTTHRQSPEG